MSAEIADIAAVIAELMHPPFEWVTRKQAAGYLNVSQSGIDRLCSHGRVLKDGMRIIPRKKKGEIYFADLIKIKEDDNN